MLIALDGMLSTQGFSSNPSRKKSFRDQLLQFSHIYLNYGLLPSLHMDQRCTISLDFLPKQAQNPRVEANIPSRCSIHERKTKKHPCHSHWFGFGRKENARHKSDCKPAAARDFAASFPPLSVSFGWVRDRWGCFIFALERSKWTKQVASKTIIWPSKAAFWALGQLIMRLFRLIFLRVKSLPRRSLYGKIKTHTHTQLFMLAHRGNFASIISVRCNSAKNSI